MEAQQRYGAPANACNAPHLCVSAGAAPDAGGLMTMVRRDVPGADNVREEVISSTPAALRSQ